MKKLSYAVVKNFINNYHNNPTFSHLRLGQAFMNDFDITSKDEVDNLFYVNNIKAEKIILANYVDWNL